MIAFRKTVFAASAFLLLAASALHAGLVFEQTSLELESDLFDEEAVAVFRFTNNGNTPVLITDLKSSCGCTVPQLEKRQYAPGESGEIRAVFKFGNRQGPQSKRVTVITNDPTKPIQQLKFSTTIPEWGDVDPKILRWEMGEKAEAKEVHLRIEKPELITVGAPLSLGGEFKAVPSGTEGNVYSYLITPSTTDVRLTERISFTITAADGDRSKSRQVALHCLVR